MDKVTNIDRKIETTSPAAAVVSLHDNVRTAPISHLAYRRTTPHAGNAVRDFHNGQTNSVASTDTPLIRSTMLRRHLIQYTPHRWPDDARSINHHGIEGNAAGHIFGANMSLIKDCEPGHLPN
jgi:hypothetical protein